jgi:CDP-paratose 2-epimerase
MPALPTPRFDRFYKHDELTSLLQDYAQALPELIEYRSLGKSHEGRDIALVVHAAAQPSHDWAAREPFTDFSVNATGTLVMLEATRAHCPDATFIFTSTNKVYGDTPNYLPLVELEKRFEIEKGHKWEQGIDETMSGSTSPAIGGSTGV